LNVLHRLYEQLPEEIRLRSTRIGEVTKLMAAYANQLPAQYGFENMKQLALATLEGCKYHDIGLLINHTLLIPGSHDTRYTLGEIFDQHPIYSKKIVDFLGDEVFDKENVQVIQDLCLYHHEKYDGSGYPYGLEKNEIPLLSALCGMAFDIDQRIYNPDKNNINIFHEITDMITRKTTDWYSPTAKSCFIKAKNEIFEYYLSLS